MNPKEQRSRMLEYLTEKLAEGGESVVACRKKLTTNAKFNSQYVKVGSDGLVLLCDREYTNNVFIHIVRRAKTEYDRVAVVFLKDGENYFRAAMPKIAPKADGRSFKNYSSDDLGKIMELRPEEIHWVNGTSGGLTAYYQIASARLEEALVRYSFQTSQFDYSHVESSRFQPRNRTSKRLYQWTAREQHTGPLKLEKRGLILAPVVRSVHACADIREQMAQPFPLLDYEPRPGA